MAPDSAQVSPCDSDRAELVQTASGVTSQACVRTTGQPWSSVHIRLCRQEATPPEGPERRSSRQLEG